MFIITEDMVKGKRSSVNKGKVNLLGSINGIDEIIFLEFENDDSLMRNQREDLMLVKRNFNAILGNFLLESVTRIIMCLIERGAEFDGVHSITENLIKYVICVFNQINEAGKTIKDIVIDIVGADNSNVEIESKVKEFILDVHVMHGLFEAICSAILGGKRLRDIPIKDIYSIM